MYSQLLPEQALFYLDLIEGKFPWHGLLCAESCSEIKHLKATEGTGKDIIKLGVLPAGSFLSFYVILIIFTWVCLETQLRSHSEIDVLVQLSPTANIWKEK